MKKLTLIISCQYFTEWLHLSQTRLLCLIGCRLSGNICAMMTKLVNKSFPFVYKNTHTDLVLHIYDLTELKTSYRRKNGEKCKCGCGQKEILKHQEKNVLYLLIMNISDFLIIFCFKSEFFQITELSLPVLWVSELPTKLCKNPSVFFGLWRL